MESSNDVLAAPLRRLEALDARLRSTVRVFRSLAPQRERPTPMRAIGEACLRAEHGAEVAWAFAEGLCAIADAQHTHFPENIYWDFDFLASSMLAGSPPGDPGLARRIGDVSERIVKLLELFGRQSVIRFRYVHDFAYGFDWAKWVIKKPEEREGVGPFDVVFLDYMQRRAHEMFELIANDDAKYPTLRDARYRNPFPFVREPAQETRLFEDLALRELIPVEAWRLDAHPRWHLPYIDLRAARARELGIQQNV